MITQNDINMPIPIATHDANLQYWVHVTRVMRSIPIPILLLCWTISCFWTPSCFCGVDTSP